MDTERVSGLAAAEVILWNAWMKTPSVPSKPEWRTLLHAWRYIKNELEREKAYESE